MRLNKLIFSVTIILLLVFSAFAANPVKNNQPPVKTINIDMTATDPKNNSSLKQEDKAKVVVFCFHKFDEVDSPSTSINTQNFEKLILFLKNEKVRFLTGKEFESFLYGNLKISGKAVLFTIDDDYKSFLKGFSVLKKHKVPFLYFLNTKFFSMNNYHLSWEEIKEIYKSGLMEIGYHSHNHDNFAVFKKNSGSEKALQMFEDDIKLQTGIFKKEFNFIPTSYAYPFAVAIDGMDKIMAKHNIKYSFVLGVLSKKVYEKYDYKYLIPRVLFAEKLKNTTNFSENKIFMDAYCVKPVK